MQERSEPDVSIKEIAEVAGVHRTTASKVLNNLAGSRINEATRKRVLEVAQRMGFARNDHFTAVTGVRSIGLLNLQKYDKQLNPFFSDVFDGVDSEARKRGLNIYLINTMERLSMVHMLQQQGFLGLITVGATRALLVPFEMTGRPLVGIEAPHGLNSSSLYTIRTDSYRGMYDATQHLIACGHRHIYYLTYLQPNGRESQVSLERFSGVATALKEAGLPFNDSRILSEWLGGRDEQAAATSRGHRAMLELLKRKPPKPFACVCYSDLDAEGAMRAAQDKGLRVPQDVSLIGYDDIPRAEELSPPLSTVAVPRIDLGSRAVQLLLDLETGDAPHETILPSRLVLRDSVLKR
jgi:LacI family transcriptional regulator